MAKPTKPPTRRDADAFFVALPAKRKPAFEFVLDELERLAPWTRPMFGCVAVYVDDRIVFILRDKRDADSGVWLATSREHHASLRRDFPNMRSIEVLGAEPTAWQVLPADADDFEESVMKACAFVRAGDPRLSKVPATKKRKPTKRRGPE